MKPFRTPDEMLDTHERMFGKAGRQCAEVILRWAGILFAVPLETMNIRVVLAPIELGPYNRHVGYAYGSEEGEGAFILGNRHIVQLSRGTLMLTQQATEQAGVWHAGFEDFIVHELTHVRQAQLLHEHEGEPGWIPKRGVHRDLAWYTAVAEACPRYLGVEFPQSSWPTGPRTRKGTLTEVMLTHWPMSLRWLALANDPRLPKIAPPDYPIDDPPPPEYEEPPRI
jgi:hypothetical protein